MGKLINNHVPGSDQEKAAHEGHAQRSQKLAEDLVAGLNRYTKEHGSDLIANTDPVDPMQLAATLEADKSC